MGVLKILGEALEAFNICKKRRRGKLRVKLEELETRKKSIIKSPPTKGKAKKIENIVKEIKKVKRELIEE